MEKAQLRQKPRHLASLVAKIHNVSADYVRKVIRTERTNDEILNTVWKVMDEDNKFQEAVRKLVPFNASKN